MKKITTILLSSLLFFGCAGSVSRKHLSEQLETMKEQRYDLCALNMEIVTDGQYVYLGNKTFVQVFSGETKVLENMVDEACLPLLERYLRIVSARSQQN